MTVCVAVLCNDGSGVIGAADQMVSTADNQTKRLKVNHLTERVVVMIAGDVALHAELLIELRAAISANSESPHLLTVKNLADSYSLAYYAAKRRRAERQFLSPLGLDAQSFVDKQLSFNEKLLQTLTQELVSYPMPSCAAIFMGIDDSAGTMSAHLYTVEDGSVYCQDQPGYATIGVGRYQAASSLMFSGHSINNGLDQSLYLTFAAKKRAEVAPGVGVETDMICVTVADGGYVMFNDRVMEGFDRIYKEAEREHVQVNVQAERKCHDFIETFRAPSLENGPEQQVELSGAPPAAEEAARTNTTAPDSGTPAA